MTEPDLQTVMGNAFLMDQMRSSSSSPSGGSPAAGSGGPGARGSTADILRDQQVREDKMTKWSPALVGWMTDPIVVTETEAGLLDSLQFRQGLMGLYDFKASHDDAFDVSEARFQGAGVEDGHQDAFRHIYWNVLMSRRLGEGFAAAFGSAHEGVRGNSADREAMDLHNNALGRRIARDNPNATLEELQEIVAAAIANGEAVLIDRNNELVFSDQEAVGATGFADDKPAGPGGMAPPEWTDSR